MKLIRFAKLVQIAETYVILKRRAAVLSSLVTIKNIVAGSTLDYGI